MGFLRLLWNLGSPAVNQQTDMNRNLIKKSKILNKAHKCHLFSFSAWNYSMNCSNKFDCSCIFVAEFCDSSHPYRQSCAGSVSVSNCLSFEYSSSMWDSAGLKLNLIRRASGSKSNVRRPTSILTKTLEWSNLKNSFSNIQCWYQQCAFSLHTEMK